MAITKAVTTKLQINTVALALELQTQTPSFGGGGVYASLQQQEPLLKRTSKGGLPYTNR